MIASKVGGWRKPNQANGRDGHLAISLDSKRLLLRVGLLDSLPAFWVAWANASPKAGPQLSICHT